MLSVLISLNMVQYDLVGTVISEKFSFNLCTLDRRQSKMLLTIDKSGSKTARYSVFDCHLGDGDKWQSKTLFLMIFYLCSLIVLTFPIAPYPVCCVVTSK